MGHRDLAQQVEGDLSPLFAELEARKAEAASRAFPSLERSAAPPRRRRTRASRSSRRGAAAILMGLTLVMGAALAPWPAQQPRLTASAPAPSVASPAQWVASAPIARPPEPAGEAAGPPPMPPTPPSAPEGARKAEPSPAEPVPPPAPVETAMSDPAPQVDAAGLAPEEARPLRCADADEACQDLAEADRLLFYAYRQAWQAKVPSDQLRAVQQSWRPGAGVAVDDSDRALLDAYDVRTRSVWALIDRWERERRR